MKKIGLLMLVLGVSTSVIGREKYGIKGEYKTAVRLLWQVDSWPARFEGVHIKRREIIAGNRTEWLQLTKQPIRVYNDLYKNLENVCGHKQRRDQLETKRFKYMNNTEEGSTRLVPIAEQEVRGYFKDSKTLKMVRLLFMADFDIALMFGFAFEDHSILKGKKYEYALVEKTADNDRNTIVATCVVSTVSGNTLRLEPQKTHIERKANDVYLSLQYNKEEFDAQKRLAGFNIYRKEYNGDRTKLNEQLIWIDRSGEKRELNYIDNRFNEEPFEAYEISPVSFFNNEGLATVLKWSEESAVPMESAQLFLDQSKNVDLIKEGVKFKWYFNESLENSIKGFVLQRMDRGDRDYQVISDTLPPSLRDFHDRSLTDSDGNKFYYRLLTIPHDSYVRWSNSITIDFVKQAAILGLKHLTGIAEVINDQVLIHLKWDADQEFIDQIRSFVIYCDRSGSELAQESMLGTIKTNTYDYKVQGANGVQYRFAISYKSGTGYLRNYSDTISVTIPSVKLPYMLAGDYEFNAAKDLVYSWQYKHDIIDLAGFRIWVNGKLYLDEHEVGANQRSWVFEGLKTGRYKIQLQAISHFGVLSNLSQEVSVFIRGDN